MVSTAVGDAFNAMSMAILGADVGQRNAINSIDTLAKANQAQNVALLGGMAGQVLGMLSPFIPSMAQTVQNVPSAARSVSSAGYSSGGNFGSTSSGGIPGFLQPPSSPPPLSKESVAANTAAMNQYYAQQQKYDNLQTLQKSGGPQQSTYLAPYQGTDKATGNPTGSTYGGNWDQFVQSQVQQASQNLQNQSSSVQSSLNWANQMAKANYSKDAGKYAPAIADYTSQLQAIQKQYGAAADPTSYQQGGALYNSAQKQFQQQSGNYQTAQSNYQQANQQYQTDLANTTSPTAPTLITPTSQQNMAPISPTSPDITDLQNRLAAVNQQIADGTKAASAQGGKTASEYPGTVAYNNLKVQQGQIQDAINSKQSTYQSDLARYQDANTAYQQKQPQQQSPNGAPSSQQMSGGSGQGGLGGGSNGASSFNSSSGPASSGMPSGAGGGLIDWNSIRSTLDQAAQFQIQQGSQAVQNSAAANGMLNSGNTLAALQDRAQGTEAGLEFPYLQQGMSNYNQNIVQQQGILAGIQNTNTQANASMYNAGLAAQASQYATQGSVNAAGINALAGLTGSMIGQNSDTFQTIAQGQLAAAQSNQNALLGVAQNQFAAAQSGFNMLR